MVVGGVVTGASVVVVVTTTSVVGAGSVIEVIGESSSELAELLPVTSGVRIATLAANATSITGLEYFSFKSILLDRG